MSQVHRFRKFYDFYIDIHFTVRRHVFFHYLTPIIVCFQSIFVISDIPADEFISRRRKYDYQSVMKSFLMMLPWRFAHDKFFTESIFTFLLISAIFFSFFYFAPRYNKDRCLDNGDFVPSRIIKVIYYFQVTFTQIALFPLIFRLSYLHQLILAKPDPMTYFTIALYFIELLILITNAFFSSIFLDAFIFIKKSSFDYLDGRTNLLFYIYKIIYCILAVNFCYFKSNIRLAILSIVLCIFLILIKILRINSMVYSFWFPCFLELFPCLLFLLKCTLSFESINNFEIHKWEKLLFFVILLIIDYCFSLIRRNPLISKIRKNSLVEGNFVIIKNLLNSDISVSEKLEIIRFLSVFPTKRKFAYNVLNLLKSDNLYNDFTINIYKDILELYFKKIDHSVKFLRYKKLIDSYYIHNTKFWQARLEGKYLTAFKESIIVIYLYYEAYTEIKALIYKYPYNEKVKFYYRNFNISTCRNRIDDKKINNNKCDKVLTEMCARYPKFLQNCEKSEFKLLKNSYFKKKLSFNDILKTDKYKYPKIKKSKHFVYIYGILSCFLIFIFNLIFIVRLKFSSYKMGNKIRYIDGEIHQFNNTLLKVIYYSFIPDNILSNISSSNQCVNELNTYISNVYSISKKNNIEDIAKYFMNDTYDYLNLSFIEGIDACEIVQTIFHNFNIFSNFTRNSLLYSLNKIIIESMNISKDIAIFPNFGIFLIAYFIDYIIMIAIFIISFIYQINNYLKRKDIVTLFLASKKRLTLLLNNKPKQAWEYFTKFCKNNCKEDSNADDSSNLNHDYYGNRTYVYVTIQMLSYFILFLCSIFYIYISFSRQKKRFRRDEIIESFKTLNVSLDLYTVFQHIYFNPNISVEQELSEIHEFYKANPFINIVSTSKILKVIQTLINSSIPYNLNDIYSKYTATLFKFYRKYTTAVCDEFIYSFYKLPFQNLISFLVLYFILWILIFIFTYKESKIFSNATNSLFHHPDYHEYLEERKNFLPPEIISFSYIKSTGRIFSVSNNLPTALGMKLKKIISKKVDKLIPLSKEYIGSNKYSRVFQYNFRNSHISKTFMSFDYKGQNLITTYMIEETHQLNNLKQTQNLTFFISPCFSYDILKGNSEFEFSNAYLIKIRINEMLPKDLFRRVCVLFRNIKSGFATIKLLNYDGSILTFITNNNIHLFHVMVFLRDINQRLQRLPQQNIIKICSSIIIKIKNGKAKANFGSEPFLDIHINNIEKYDIILMNIPSFNIAIRLKSNIHNYLKFKYDESFSLIPFNSIPCFISNNY